MFGSLSAFPHCATPSHTPVDVRAVSRQSTGLISNTGTPFESYRCHQRQANPHSIYHRNTTYQAKIPLTLLAQPVAQLGYVGGSFKASCSTLKHAPLPSLYHPPSTAQRGTWNVPIRSARYTPSSNRHTSDVLIQILHWNESHEQLHQTRSRIASRSAKHRLEGDFFLNGNSASLHRRGMLSQEDVMQFQNETPAGNVGLFYGKVSGLRHQKPNTKAMKQFRETLYATGAEENHANQQQEKFPKLDALTTNRTVFVTQGFNI